ncbi:hypothetical protein ACIRBX_01685 [Kitasatospora sp. NPDC096147]|uniref:hypothetical protein n=1 Tax=Kitasatospora sp. NPDC096147 TaxID=3364093 RepID=UPI0037F5005F
MTADRWYVLVEEDTRATRRADGVELKLHRWTLVATHAVDGGEEAARALAEEAALRHLPDLIARHTRPGDVPARHAFVTSDGSWLVLLKHQHRECHVRITTARLVHSSGEVQAPPRTLKDKFRTALDGPAPAPAPWTPQAGHGAPEYPYSGAPGPDGRD